jgi:hypothetical protein
MNINQASETVLSTVYEVQNWCGETADAFGIKVVEPVLWSPVKAVVDVASTVTALFMFVFAKIPAIASRLSSRTKYTAHTLPIYASSELLLTIIHTLSLGFVSYETLRKQRDNLACKYGII